MKMTERIRRNMQPDKEMTHLSIRMPKHVADDLEEVATAFDFSGPEAVVRRYISQGLREHLAQLETKRTKENVMEEFSHLLLAHGVPERAVQDAAAEMRASNQN